VPTAVIGVAENASHNEDPGNFSAWIISVAIISIIDVDGCKTSSDLVKRWIIN
jgi:hypothetical protein